ncbi:hypothetical protein DCAR_0518997 [Daucus carota subsp. sativus]|uniref:Uncharacterized protein n=1 Tax=Daucus carota subsp. sativus TaxID=79200 RepID=A0A164XN05_DAUCS|nr:hypothetical protein DCAR_0518997 [Daucus carota subsp. sativus]
MLNNRVYFAGFPVRRCGKLQPEEPAESLTPVTCQIDEDCVKYNIPQCVKCVDNRCHCDLSEAQIRS